MKVCEGIRESNAGISPLESPTATFEQVARSRYAADWNYRLRRCARVCTETPHRTVPPSARETPPSPPHLSEPPTTKPPVSSFSSTKAPWPPPARRSPFLIASSTVRALNYGVAQASTRPNPPTHHLDMRPARIYAMYISNQAIL